APLRGLRRLRQWHNDWERAARAAHLNYMGRLLLKNSQRVLRAPSPPQAQIAGGGLHEGLFDEGEAAFGVLVQMGVGAVDHINKAQA
ncbi:MAG: hypothetical protein RL186_1321, partial [Pseudomonadota bacterium]